MAKPVGQFGFEACRIKSIETSALYIS